MSGIIRLVERDDQDAVAALWSELHAEQQRLDERFALADDAGTRWRNDFAGWVHGDSRWMWVAEQDGSIVGFLTAERNFLPPVHRAVSELFLTEIFVVPDARRKGIGRSLVEHALLLAEEEAIERIRLIALAANSASKSFWRSFGARPFSETLLLELDAPASSEQRKRSIGF